jgi:oligogalacturonide lyase
LQHLSGILARVLADDAAGPCLVSPDGTRCLFTRNAGPDREFWSAALGGSKPQLAAKGLVSFPFWSADSSRILFLRQLESGTSEIRESSLAGDERLVSRTSRFGSFSPNHDASVFVGASASKAQPLIALLLRTGQRELPLCEIHAGEAESATPVFSPDNRRVYFQSEREGKPALYSINTEELVEAAF